jgi:hypothetical protein
MLKFDNIDKYFEVTKWHTDDSFQAVCPAHPDNKASLTVSRSDSRPELAVLHCHAGCSYTSIVDAIKSQMPSNNTKPTATQKPTQVYPEDYWQDNWQAQYRYYDNDGNVVYRIIRTKSKEFIQQSWMGDGWVLGLNKQKKVFYRWHDVKDSEHVVVCEGEKDCDRAHQYGIPAIAFNGGAGGWKPELTEILRGKKVILMFDTDVPGRKAARKVVPELLQVASAVFSIRLPINPPNGKDFSDWADLIERDGLNVRTEFNKILKSEHVIKHRDPTKRITLEAQAEKPPIVLYAYDTPASPEYSERKIIAGLKRSITTVTAQHGFGKSTLSWAVVAAVLADKLKLPFRPLLHGLEPDHHGVDTLGFVASGINQVLYIDTEQDDYWVQKKMYEAVFKRAGCSTTPEWLDTYSIRALKSAKEKFEFIENKLLEKRYDLLIIDQLADISRDINNMEGTNDLLADLLGWCDEYNLSILNTFHPNQTESNMKLQGRLGSELIRKSRVAFMVLSAPAEDGNQPAYKVTTRYGTMGKNSYDTDISLYYKWNPEYGMMTTYLPAGDEEFSPLGLKKNRGTKKQVTV